MNRPLDSLRPLPTDPRDYSHAQVFGAIAANDLPTHDFLVSVPLEMKNQDINYFSDYCASYAAAECAEDIDQVIFCPEWSFAQAKALLAASKGSQVYGEIGLNLRDICQAGVKKGFLPRLYDPFHCDTAARPPREVIVLSDKWPALDDKAAPYKKSSFFMVDGPHDFFDNIRSAMWQHLGERISIMVGAMWRESWTQAPDGIIPTSYESFGSGHAFKICGQKTIDGVIYLVAQLSDGKDFGDQGFCYFPREVVNKEFSPFGAFAFPQIDASAAKWHITNGVSLYDSLPLKILKYLRIISKYLKI